MKANLKILILVAILAAGIVVQKAGYFDAARELAPIETFAQAWWAPPAVVLLQVVLYMFALPGSVLIWTLGAVYPPWAATAIIVAGGVGGSAAAYFFSAGLSTSWVEKLTRSEAYRLLQRNSAFLQLFALRCMPGFPHSFINYSSGILKVSLARFISSTALGLTVKGYIYCSAIYRAFHIQDNGDVISFSSLWPLLLLVLFSLLGVVIQKNIKRHQNNTARAIRK